MKKLFISIFTCVFALFALGTSTFAWFSMNDEVTATGMSVYTKASGSLVISTETLISEETNDITVSLSSTAAFLRPATHKDDSTTGLEYCTNPTEVDPKTGLQKGSVALTFANVAAEKVETYAKDFLVYVGSQGMETGSPLLVAITNTGVTSWTHLAASIDFYAVLLDNPTSETTIDNVINAEDSFKGTLNVAKTGETVIELAENVPGIVADDASQIAIVMRVYFDGALEQTSGQAYINNNKVDDSELAIDVKFYCEEVTE